MIEDLKNQERNAKISKLFAFIMLCILVFASAGALTGREVDGVTITQTSEALIQVKTEEQDIDVPVKADPPDVEQHELITEIIETKLVPGYYIPKHTLAYKNKNPFNLKYRKQVGATRGLRGFAKFRTVEDGIEAGYKQIQLDRSRGMTIEEFITKFAPPNHNDTDEYIRFVCKRVGEKPATDLWDINIDTLALAVMKFECGIKVVYVMEVQTE